MRRLSTTRYPTRKPSSAAPTWYVAHWRPRDGPEQAYCREYPDAASAARELPALVARVAMGPHVIIRIDPSPVGPDTWGHYNKRNRDRWTG